MKTTVHIYASAAAGGAAYGLTGSAEMSASCLLSGIFLDVDHILDFCLLTDERFTIKGFLSWCHELRWTRIYLILHSYELYALLALAAFFFTSEALKEVLLGMGLHLLMDQAGNKGLNKWFYFMAFSGTVPALKKAPWPREPARTRGLTPGNRGRRPYFSILKIMTRQRAAMLSGSKKKAPGLFWRGQKTPRHKYLPGRFI